MDRIELTELTALLCECAVQAEGLGLDGDVLDARFLDPVDDAPALFRAVGIGERGTGRDDGPG
ncbi:MULTISPECIES: hypothetical protein [unclassified Streptomyces]|uniref:hypothetical protein n=1 Tax=unclassified Streptomyces TaxID=2593676 RepID=UPI002DD8EC57|nr:hypothetical protein [Streptomyces sp. NBC_01750]WSA98262.1 hypothetical protein OIE54_02765 [Streptomyces sp. NBC_01794]WSD37200.1 hypothetical protein OG966_38025 [Streptomyces sp. NBC_01750]